MPFLEELINKVRLLNEQKMYEEVIMQLPESVLEDCNNEALYVEKALSYFKLSNNELFINAVERALSLNATNPEANYLKGIIYSNQHQYDKAIACYNFSIQIGFTNSKPYAGIGGVYRRTKEYEKALDYFNKAIEL